jgi:hypothetical protein
MFLDWVVMETWYAMSPNYSWGLLDLKSKRETCSINVH